jgi:hypothetical protein
MRAVGDDSEKQELASRWLRLQGFHRQWANRMWAGTLAEQFTDEELRALDDWGYVSEHDRRRVRAVGRKP